MTPLENIRIELWHALSQRGFVRRDKTCAALFVSDYPRLCVDAPQKKQALLARGFLVVLANGLFYIDLSLARYEALLKTLSIAEPLSLTDETWPLYSLALRLFRANAPLCKQPFDAVRRALLALEAREFKRLYQFLAPFMAECLRTGAPLPCALAPFILHTLSQEACR